MDLKRVDDLYRDKVILDHCRNPRNFGVLSNSDFVCDAVNSFCGDEIHIQINIDEYQKIINVGYQSEGCAINQATGSLISEYIHGLRINEVVEFTSYFSNIMQSKPDSVFLNQSMPDPGDLQILYRVKEFPIRIKCVLLSIEALKSGLCSDK
jgi:nitrogen fixation NifU-like protein